MGKWDSTDNCGCLTTQNTIEREAIDWYLASPRCSECPHPRETSWKVVLGFWECQYADRYLGEIRMMSRKTYIPDVKNGFRL